MYNVVIPPSPDAPLMATHQLKDYLPPSQMLEHYLCIDKHTDLVGLTLRERIPSKWQDDAPFSSEIDNEASMA